LAIVRQLLVELGGSGGLEDLSARGTSAHLERDLRLGSLERVELMLRLGQACAVRLPERVVAEANTVEDLIEAILRNDEQESEQARDLTGLSGISTATYSGQPLSTLKPGLEREIRTAESLTQVLRLRCLAEPERAHIHLYEENDALRTMTFGELHERASLVAAELTERGLEPAQTVAIMLPTCAEFFSTFAGILLAGGIPVPIYPPFRADRIAEYATRQSSILRNAEARFLITWRRAEGLARLLQPQVPTLRDVLNAEKLCAKPATAIQEVPSWKLLGNLAHRARGEDIAFLQYTSGSTGNPKGVILTHANLLANIRSIVSGVEIGADDVAVSWLPLYHDMGLIGAWFVPLFTGIPLVVMSPITFLSQPVRWLRAIQRHRGTISPAPNFGYELCVRKIADEDLGGLDLSSWRAALNGAEPVHAETIERFISRFAPYGFKRGALMPVYGLAEASLGVSAPRLGSGARIDRIDRATFESSGKAVTAVVPNGTGSGALEFVGAGRPLADVECRIVLVNGQDAGERREGELWFRGPSATRGYYRNPQATAELLKEGGWLNSGDRAYWAEGEIFITGRAKDLVIKGGRNLYPHEIEDIAGKVAGVRTGCVVAFGAPDASSGTERLVVAAEIRKAEESKRIAGEISRRIQDALGIPPDVVQLLPPQSIPKTSSGKLRRSETRRLYIEGKLGKKQQATWIQIAGLTLRGAIPRTVARAARGTREAAQRIYGIYALVAAAAVIVPTWLAVLTIGDRRRAAELVHGCARRILRLAGVKVEIAGAEILAGSSVPGAVIFAPNHASYVDTVILMSILPPDVRFVAKGEVADMPFFGTMADRSGQFMFDRSNPQARVRQAEEVKAALERGESVVIYPEGTFTPATGIRPFQLGAFKAAADAQRPVCPVAIRGARHILRDKTYLPRRGAVRVTFGPLVAPNPDGGDGWREIVRLRDETREIISRNSGEPLL